MYFMSTVCGRPQGGMGSGPSGRMWTGGGSQKPDFFVDVINGWPLTELSRRAVLSKLLVDKI